MRRIRKANIQFISLVPAGANLLQPIYKTDGSFTIGSLIKAADGFDDKGELTAVVYAPNHRDSQGDIADADVVKQMAHDFVANGASIDIKHDGKAVSRDRAQVAETFIVQKSDERFHGWKDRTGADVDLTGAWATVIKIHDPDLRKKYRSGEWAGVSMGGTAIVDQEKSTIEEFVAAVSKIMNPALTQNPQPSTEDTMDKTQFEALQKSLTDGFKDLGESLVKALKPEEKKTETPATPATPAVTEEKAPVFKGDYADADAVRKHSLELQLFNLKKGLDMSNPDVVEDFLEKSAEIRAQLDELKAEMAERAPVRKSARAPRAEARGSQSFEDDSDVPSFLQVLPVTKGERNAMEAGAAMAAQLNKRLTGAKE